MSGNYKRTVATTPLGESVPASLTIRFPSFRAAKTINGPASIETIEGGQFGDTITIYASGGDITLVDSLGNLDLGGSDFVIPDTRFHSLTYNGTNWVSGNAEADGAANEVQLGDGNGGFTSASGLTFNNATDTLQFPAGGKIRGSSTDSDQFRIYGNATETTAGKLELYGEAASARSAFFLAGQPTVLDQPAGTSTIKGASSNTASTSNSTGGRVDIVGGDSATTGNANGGDVRIYGGDKNNSGTEGNVVLAWDATDARGQVGIRTNTINHDVEVNGEINLSSSPAKNNDPSTVHIGDYFDIVSKDIVITIGAPADTFDLGWNLPGGALILCAATNIETTVVGSGGATNVGLGSGTSYQKYTSSLLALNSKSAQRTRDYATTTAGEDLKLFAIDGAGSLTGTLDSGSVRVRIVYIDISALPNA